MATARALVFTRPGRIDIEDVAVPDPGPDEVMVETRYSGISTGTELLAYRGELDPQMAIDERLGALQGGTFRYPFRYGYACVGDAGGELVFAYQPHQDRFVAPRADLLVLGDGVDPRQATLLPLIETALQISLDAGAVLEQDVIVMGLGPVGLLTALLVDRAGGRVLGVDPNRARREVAAAVGVETLDVAGKGRSGGVPLVIEASGRPEALAAALDLLAHEGTVIVASWYGTKEVPLNLGGPFHRRRLTVRSSQVSTIPASLANRWTVERRRSTAVELLRDLPLGPLASHVFPFDDAGDAFAALDRGDDRSGGQIVHAALCYE